MSVDGVGATYERLRRRPFAALLAAAALLGSVAPFGINVVVNADKSEPGWRWMDVLQGFAKFRREEPKEGARSAGAIDFQEDHAGL